jgi:hypothetical protein
MNRSKSFGDGHIDLHEDLKDALCKILLTQGRKRKLKP